ncbi:MAG: LamG domain-containing protein [Verrucomicrobiia bacterium]
MLATATSAPPRAVSFSPNRLTTTAFSSIAVPDSQLSAPPSGLIVWWRFDEGSGGTVGDSSGNGHTATLQGDSPPTWVNGVTSGALNFDGSQNYVESDDAFNETISAYTIEAWFAADSAYGENPAILSTLGDDIGFNYLGDIVIYTNSVFHGNSIGLNTRWDVLTAPIGLIDGKWHHVAGTWDGATSSLYVDGQLVATQADVHTSFTWTTPLRLAYRDTNGGCNYGGAIGELLIYNRALSSNEVAASYNTDTVGDGIPDWWRLKYFGSGTTTDSVSCAACDPNGDGVPNLQEYQNGTNPLLPPGLTVPPNLLLWWRFDEATDAFVGDVSGNGHSGLLLGNPPPVWTNGVTSGALSFDGSQNYVQTELPFHETITGYTIEAWFSATSAVGENPAIISTLGDDIGFNYLGDIVIYTNSYFHGNSIGLNTRWDVLTAPLGLFDGNWHYVAGTWDGTNSSLYVDGQLVATQPDADDPFSWTTPLRLAYRDTNGGCNYGGNIGEVRVYSRALASNEVAAAYNTDSIGDGIPDWWRMKYFGSGTTTNAYTCASCSFIGDGVSNLSKYLEGCDPTKPAVPDSSGLVNLAVFTPLE